MLMTGVRGHALMLMCAANNAGGDEPSNDRIATFVGCVTESPSQSSSSDAANTVGVDRFHIPMCVGALDCDRLVRASCDAVGRRARDCRHSSREGAR